MGNSTAKEGFGKKTSSDEVGEKFGQYAAGKFVVVTGKELLASHLHIHVSER